MMNFFIIGQLQSQLSPGDLTTAHADLEGIRNCTKCHTIGAKVENNKCLDCHKEIQTRLDDNLGFHSSKEVKGRNCFECHSEHHGRNFDAIRFDEKNFNHNLTGYELTGKHKPVDCRQCHIPDFIKDSELKDRKETYLGLVQDCAACHEDVHQNTLSIQDCASCHTTESFAPATLFDHDDSAYPLKGKHVEVDCIKCHQKEMRKGKEFQQFSGVEFSNCTSCHEDAHQNNLGTNCKQCHSEESFNSTRRLKNFNHQQTKFALKGAHNNVNCFDCHQPDSNPMSVFQDQLGVATNECNTCHEDAHDGKFGLNCVDCHNENSWTSVNTNDFNHSLTNFELVGKHNSVDCRKCHTTSLTDPLPHNACAACHSDFHNGEFAQVGNEDSPDCASCHIKAGFDLTTYSLDRHQESHFPLDGAHLATPCFACHLSENEEWHFREIGQTCVDCHDDVHDGFISETYYPQKTCEKCHVTESWTENIFDHNLTEFPLEGKHAETKCMACHEGDEKKGENRYAGFADRNSTCVDCHSDIHNGQFVENGITDCARCHGFESWDMADFDHNRADFKLEGKHAEVDCAACHRPIRVGEEVIVQYRFESFECVVCHQ